MTAELWVEIEQLQSCCGSPSMLTLFDPRLSYMGLSHVLCNKLLR